MTQKQKGMLYHAYGYYTKSPGFRSHYCTQLDDPDMKTLIKGGYFNKKPAGVGSVGKGCGIFHMSDLGIGLCQRELNDNKFGRT